jgi:hypothetical protein
MFCPQCGQQQVSDEVRFCSRCGFQLGAVTSLLATRGAPLAGFAEGGAVPETPRRKGARQGGKILLIGIFLIPLFALLGELIGETPELGLFGLIVALGGLLRLIYALVFEDGPLRRPKSQGQFAYVPPAAASLPSGPARSAAELPPAQGIPARSYAPPRVDTSEIGRPPSVTEGTTRLLDDREDPSAR